MMAEENKLDSISPDENMSLVEKVVTGGIITLPEKDSQNPRSWSFFKKIAHTLAYACTAFSAQFSASIISPAIEQLSHQFHVDAEVPTLVFGCFLLGQVVGPFLFAPMSEIFGRKLAVFVPCFIGGVFICVTANVTSIWAALVFRFLAGLFSAAPVVSSGGAMADLWHANERAAAMVLYATVIIAGSSISPTFGALLVETGKYGWRWTCWLSGLLQLILPIVNLCLCSESYVPVIEARYVKQRRLQTGMWGVHAKHEEWSFDIREFLQIHLMRPVLMFATPIVFLMVIYSSFVYGVLFLIITSAGQNYAKFYGWGLVSSHCSLIAILVGAICGGLVNIYGSSRYARLSGKGVASPEDRLIPMMIAGWIMPVGAFLYGWSMRTAIHWLVPTVGLALTGIGLAVVIQGAIVYIVDAYTKFSASAIAANTALRSICAGVFPLFARQMYNSLGPGWASSVVGFVTIAAAPIPWLFYLYGPQIRQKDPYASNLR